MCRKLPAIRYALVADIPELQAIEVAAASLFHKTPYWELALAPPLSAQTYETHFAKKHPVFVAEIEANNEATQDQPRMVKAGFAVAAPLGEGLHLYELSVHKKDQGRGVGRSLLEHVLTYAREKGFPCVTLTTYSDIGWNGPFYRSAGFSILPAARAHSDLKTILQKEIDAGANAETRCIMHIDLSRQ